jgi:two-component system, chemotaxis family, sensor kinase CheA
MPNQEEEFLKRLRATFNVEAEEHLQAIASGLLELEKSPAPARQQAVIESVYREAHSLKGAARAVNLSDIEAICQALESVLAVWKQQRIDASTETFDTLHTTVDAIRSLLTAPAEGQGAIDQRRRAELLQGLVRLQTQLPSTSHRDFARAANRDPEPPAHQAPLVDAPPAPEKSLLSETVRVSTAVLDARLLQAEEMLAVKLTAAQRAADLRDVMALFEPWRKAWTKFFAETRAARPARDPGESDSGYNPPVAGSAALTEFIDRNSGFMSALENRLVAVAAQAEQDRQNVGRLVDNLLEDSKRLLMLPFATLTAPLPKLVRDLGRDQGKEVELLVHGDEVEIDKRVLEEMKDAFTHILRNSIDHGVEKPDLRARLNKPRRASINIAASRVNGHMVEILVADDGAGVDLEKLKASAVRHGVVTEAEARSLSEEETLGLMYQSEVSTSQIITEISGRGLGMAIVRAKVEQLGGQISVESKRGVGTTLRMVLPLALAQFRGILVEAAGQLLIVPTVNVERVLRVSPREIQTVENRETIALQGRAVALVRLEALLELPSKTTNRHDDSEHMPVVVVCSAEQRIALTVDAVLHEEEVLVKPFKKPLVRVRNIAGATVLGSGRAVPILNVADLMKSARKSSSVLRPAPVEGNEMKAEQIKILVAEDSITSRMLLKNILESAGYQVKTAVDGMDAFTALREDRFQLVVSDVEMPRLNGFDLTARIRADKRLADLPVVLVTALESREERERGIDAGANAYIIKSNFEQSNLLEAVRRLV